MATRDVDIVIEGLGINAFRPLGEAAVNTTFYDRAVKIRNLKRTLRAISCGADADYGPNIQALIEEIDKATDSQMGRIGALCLYGFSNASGMILALAKALQDRQAPKATYIGLGDLTLMPFGRSPPSPGIGTLQPINRPPISLGLDVALGWTVPGVLIAKGLPPSVSDGPPPHIADPGVDGEIRENYYTVEGNRARVFPTSPAGSYNWWWTSTQTNGEVHGEIPGWNNIRMTTVSDGSILTRGPGSIDEGHHDNLCGMALREMRHQAGLALGNFVTKLPPE